MRIDPAERIGLPPLRGVGVEQKVVKVPHHEVVVAFGRPQAFACAGVELEQDLAIEEKRQNLGARKTLLLPEPADFLRRRQQNEGGRYLRVANPKQRAGARRFQHHLLAAPPQIGEPR